MKLSSKYYVISEKSSDDKRLLAFDDGKVMFPKRGVEGLTTGICYVTYKQDKGKYIVFNGKMVEPERVTYEQMKQFCQENDIVPNGTFTTNLHNILIMYGMKGAGDRYNPTYPLISVNGKACLVNFSALLTTADKERNDYSDRYNAEIFYSMIEDVTSVDVMDTAVRHYRSDMSVNVYDNKIIVITSPTYFDHTFVKISGSVVEDKHIEVKGEVTASLTAEEVSKFMQENHICAYCPGYDDNVAIVVKDVYFSNLQQSVLVFNGRAWSSSYITPEERQEVNESYNKFAEFKRNCGRHVTKSTVFQLRDLSDQRLLKLDE